MSEQVKIVAKDSRTQQEKHFDKLYAAFFEYYQEALRKDVIAPHEKVRLVLTTQFFDEPSLQKVVFPLFAEFSSNLEDKRAAARAAYFDALTIHNRTAGLVFETVSNKDVVSGKVKL